MQKDYGKTRSGNHTAYDERHKLLSLTENEVHLAVGTGHQPLRESQQQRQNGDGIDGLNHKLQTKNLQGYEEQNQVYGEVTVGDRNSCGIEDDCRQTVTPPVTI